MAPKQTTLRCPQCLQHWCCQEHEQDLRHRKSPSLLACQMLSHFRLVRKATANHCMFIEVLPSMHNVFGPQSFRPRYLASNNVLKHGEIVCYSFCLRRQSAQLACVVLALCLCVWSCCCCTLLQYQSEAPQVCHFPMNYWKALVDAIPYVLKTSQEMNVNLP